MGERIFLGDIQEGVHLVSYKPTVNQFFLLANETTPKWVTASCLLDYSTVATGDKFGNFSVSRLPPEISGAAEDDPVAGSLREGSYALDNKMVTECSFHVGSMVQIISTGMFGGTHEAIIYGTLEGAIGVMAPFLVQSEISFFQQLEQQLRDRDLSLCGREHLSYRSAFSPNRHVVDGDLCELFLQLSHKNQKEVAEEIDRTPAEIMRKLEDMRDRSM
eukprot:Plantae.Rhodophyta-Rhodochaete_pulchella.ctg2915.p2 GENE.Plantae.Rhodophyta-Rhodochaete_pulchella.ctg2915~~Plantae.Rhodophyta-Rhodochaete_pulchella.ctg2915.p2  ORF type:complete len:218 (+),score=28.91 Plantae.Rhodophyta-Rhodochaete_pulchella.ctg2915:3-656(+)